MIEAKLEQEGRDPRNTPALGIESCLGMEDVLIRSDGSNVAMMLLTNSLKFMQTLNEGMDIGTIQAVEVCLMRRKYLNHELKFKYVG